ncbi:MAG: hypothetical protein JWQ74_958 [Marmoricola sp.]|nr:hypothetical protein [Marmoricola sp.]
MKKSAYILVGTLVALLVTVGFNSSAQAYPETRISLSVDRQVLFAGDSFTATTASNVGCTWDLDWAGTDRPGTGTTVVSTFLAPQVTRQTTMDLNGTCTYTNPTSGTAKVAAGTTTWKHSIPITVMPTASGAAAALSGGTSSNLSGTGGPDRLFLLGGLALLLAGATAVTVARRRADQAELLTQTA